MTFALKEALSLFDSLSHGCVNENAQSVLFEIPLFESQPEVVESLIGMVESSVEPLSNFTVEAIYDSDRPSSTLLSERSGNLRVPDLEVDPRGWFENYRKEASYYIDEGDLSQLANLLFERPPDEVAAIVSFRMIKAPLEAQIVQNSADIEDPTRCNPSIWTSFENLQSWVTETGIPEVCDDIFSSDQLPLLMILGQPSDTPVPSTSSPYWLDVGEELHVADFDQKVDSYQSQYRTAEQLFRNHGQDCPIPATFFDNTRMREAFEKVFLYSTTLSIGDSISSSKTGLTYKISSDKKVISGTVEWGKTQFTHSELSSLFNFIQRFYEKSSSEVYRDLWQRAIVEHSDSLSTIAQNSSDIIYYYESLEESAIEGNFSDLSGAVQDAQIFIGDVTNTLSDSAISLTAEIQKVVIAIFTIVGVNAFLLARNGGVASAVPFSSAFIMGLLVFYFPIAQSRVSEISKIIDEGKNDAEVYSDLAHNVGADELVDLERFESRQEAYIKLAKKRVGWAEDRLKQGYVLITLFWLCIGLYGLLTTSLFSPGSLVILSTTAGALWIWLRQRDLQYTWTLEIRGRKVGLQPILVLSFWAVALGGYLVESEATILDLPSLPL